MLIVRRSRTLQPPSTLVVIGGSDRNQYVCLAVRILSIFAGDHEFEALAMKVDHMVRTSSSYTSSLARTLEGATNGETRYCTSDGVYRELMDNHVRGVRHNVAGSRRKFVIAAHTRAATISTFGEFLDKQARICQARNRRATPEMTCRRTHRLPSLR